METVKAKYNCGQDALIKTSILIWNYCKARIGRMGAYKSKYTEAMCEGEIEAANAVLQMPDNAARQAKHEMTRVTMSGVAKTGRNLFQDMKGYVRDAYPGAEFDITMDAAGWRYFAGSVSSWADMQGLFSNAINFINLNDAVLKTKGFMPDTFVILFAETRASFDALYTEFVTAQQESHEATEARLIACNNLYEKVSGCCADGQNVFRDDGVVRNEFVFSTVLEMVSPTGPAGLKGYATYVINGEPVIGMTAEIEAINKRVPVDPIGFYDFGPLTGGVTYEVRYLMGDVVKDTEMVAVPVGTTVHRNVAIE